MFRLICLTKTYNLRDIEAWLQYHSKFVPCIWLLDNESPVGDVEMRFLADKYNAIYMPIAGFADQWALFGQILNKKTDIFIQNDDFVCFLDDDEYLYCSDNKNFENIVKAQFKQLDCILLPEILMSTKHYQAKRGAVLPEFATYRRNDLSSQGKSIIWWNDWSEYSFNLHDEEKGHVPWINKRRYSDVVGSGVSKTTYGLTPKNLADQELALIHYHIKSEDDWNMKIKRGSAATPSTETRQNGSYDDDIKKNIKFGGYDVQDFTMKRHFESVINTV